MGKPKAHLFIDGGGMVTGTHDIQEARRLIVAEKADGSDDRYDIADASAMFRARYARLETGRIVPNGNRDWDPEYAWFWRRGYELGKPGVTRAVVWS